MKLPFTAPAITLPLKQMCIRALIELNYIHDQHDPKVRWLDAKRTAALLKAQNGSVLEMSDRTAEIAVRRAPAIAAVQMTDVRLAVASSTVLFARSVDLYLNDFVNSSFKDASFDGLLKTVLKGTLLGLNAIPDLHSVPESATVKDLAKQVSAFKGKNVTVKALIYVTAIKLSESIAAGNIGHARLLLATYKAHFEETVLDLNTANAGVKLSNAGLNARVRSALVHALVRTNIISNRRDARIQGADAQTVAKLFTSKVTSDTLLASTAAKVAPAVAAVEASRVSLVTLDVKSLATVCASAP
jgi:hypothetical protein